MSKSIINPSKKSRGRPPVDSEQVNLRIQREALAALDTFAAEEPDHPNRTEAIRRIIVEHLAEDEDAAINDIYKSSEPGIGAKFMKAIIGHLRTHVRQNPDITVDQCKEFVLDLFNDYDQDLEEFARAESSGINTVGKG